MASELWTPDGVEYIQSWKVGTSEDGVDVLKHEFKLSYRGETEFFGVVAVADEGESIIEDNAAWTAEHSIQKINERLQKIGSALRPEELALKKNTSHRRELAAIFRDFRKHQQKRRESTGGKIYYAGLH